MPRTIETTLHRIVHEALSNVIEHAVAKQVWIRLRREQGNLVLSVRDDGPGFDPEAVQRWVHHGRVSLIGARKRAELPRGSFATESLAGKGTEVIVRVPLPVPEDHRGESAEPLQPTLARQDLSGGEAIAVLIVDDHTVVREGLRAMLDVDEMVEVVGEAADGREALDLVAELYPKVVLMDAQMPGMDGLEATRQLKERHPGIAVIVMTNDEEDAFLANAVAAGAAGYLPKGTSRELLSQSIRVAASGGALVSAGLLGKVMGTYAQKMQREQALLSSGAEAAGLTERELKVLQLLAEGRTNREIGNSLGVAEITVKRYMQTIIAKLRASDRTHAAVIALRLGLIE